MSNDSEIGELLCKLGEESLDGARQSVRVLTFEEPQQDAEHVHAWLARSVLRRTRLLRRVGYHPVATAKVAKALGVSRERERAALFVTEAQFGTDVVVEWQSILDQRLLILEAPAGIVGDFLKRRGRVLSDEMPPELVVSLLAEQILQTDLCALLGSLPARPRADTQLIQLLSSRSALVRAAAETALVRHPEAAGELRRQLRQQTASSVQARLLEVLHQPLEHRDGVLGGGVTTRPQHCHQQLLGPVSHLCGDQQRQVAVLPIVAVKRGELLLAMRLVVGGVEVQDDPAGLVSGVARHKLVDEDLGQAPQAGAADAILKTAQRWLGSQVPISLRPPPQRRFEGEVRAQIVGLVAVLVAAGDLIDALAEQGRQLMPNLTWVARIVQAGGQGGGQTQTLIGGRQQHDAAVAGDVTAVETATNLFAMKASKVQLLKTLCHTGEPRRVSFYVV